MGIFKRYSVIIVGVIMIYKYIIDNGGSGEDLVTNYIFSKTKFSAEEFKKIVIDAYKVIGENRDDWDYFGLGVTIADHLAMTDDRFFYLPTECTIEVDEYWCGDDCDKNGVHIGIYCGC